MGEKQTTVTSKTNELHESFVSEGFVVLKQFLTEDEIIIARSEVENVIASCRESACVRPNNTLLPLRWNDFLVELFLKLPYRVQMLREAVGARDLKWISGYVSSKEAQSAALWWHQDWWCWQHQASFQKTASQIAVMCYLTSTNKHTGALKVLPGSHHQSSPLHDFLPEAHADAANQITIDHPAMSDYPNQITLNIDAGDAVAIDYRLLHGTHENKNNIRRDCILLTFAPSWCDLPDDIKGHLISHQALPFGSESLTRATYNNELLPTFDGLRRDLTVNRLPPRNFSVYE